MRSPHGPTSQTGEAALHLDLLAVRVHLADVHLVKYLRKSLYSIQKTPSLLLYSMSSPSRCPGQCGHSSDQLQLQEKWPRGFWRHRSLKPWMSWTPRMEQAWRGCRQGSYRQRHPCCIAPPHEAPIRNPVSLELSILTQMRSVSVGSSQGLVELTSRLSQGHR